MTDYLSLPPRLNELWPWFNAMSSWDWGDTEPLAELILAEPIPPEFKAAVSAIVSGNRKRSRNWHKSKIPAAERMKVAGSISLIIDLCRAIRRGTAEGLEAMADRLAMEPIDIVRHTEGEARKIQADAAEQLGVSVETIENLLREMRERIERWPVV